MSSDSPRRIAVAVEGDGEVYAVPNLLLRLAQHLDLPLRFMQARRWPAINTDAGLCAATEHARRTPSCDGLLILHDDDDGCPKRTGPLTAARLKGRSLPFPAASVLLCPEYEVLFLPCLAQMAGRRLGGGVTQRPGLRVDVQWSGAWESKRGIKEWLAGHFVEGRRYKPTLDQLPLTQMIDLSTLLAADVPCVGTLERALRFLAAAGPGEVYPPPR